MMDPLHQVRKVLVQSYFSFYNVFSTSNETAFMFSLTVEDLGYPVEIRGLRLSQVILSWPMTGCFFINAEKEPFYELKPLIVNSSRKGRKEEYIIIPKDNLKSGKNVLRFKIYCIDKERFINKYQYEEKGTYFFAINSINKLKPDELVS